MSIREKILSKDGLCTSLVKTDDENVQIILLILEYWLDEPFRMERANRCEDNWASLNGEVPMNFTDFRYRIVRGLEQS